MYVCFFVIQGFIVGSISGICRFYEKGRLFSYKVVLFSIFLWTFCF